MKIKVEILTDGVRLDGVERSLGDVVDLPHDLLAIWEEKGYCRIKKDETPIGPTILSNDPPKDPPKDPPIEPELKHLGGGYYELPNGDKVKGKEAALEALKALEAEKEKAELEALKKLEEQKALEAQKALKGGDNNDTTIDNGSNDGTGDNTGSSN